MKQRTLLYLTTAILLLVAAMLGVRLVGPPGGSTTAPTPTVVTSATAAAPIDATPSRAIATSARPPQPAPVQGASPLAAATPLVTAPRRYTYRVLDVLPHDPNAFTQGLIYTDGVFYEGTGLNGRSSLRKVDPATGQVLLQHDLGNDFFGEGVTLFGDKLYQLTWQNQTGFVYDPETFTELRRFTYPTEGWGITHDEQQLIVSDGTPTLYFWDPLTLQETRRITVTFQGQLVPQLNELETIDGEIWANIWQTDYVVRIDPASGVVTGVVDFAGLLNYAPPFTTPVDVLNGITYDAAGKRLFVTGKLWPALFQVEVIEATP